MKWILSIILILVLSISGCTQTEQPDRESDTGGYQENETGPGEVINVSYGSDVNVSLDVSSLVAFNRIRIIKNGIVIQEIGKSLNRYSLNLTTTIAKDTWFSADVWGGDNTPEYHDFVHAISNPVWVNVEEVQEPA